MERRLGFYPITLGSRRRSRAFSLLELLVVLTIISILVLIFVPNSHLARNCAGNAVKFHEKNARDNNRALRGNFDDVKRPEDFKD
ncbi:MAG: prepilin-type N-terminal cleavage/methylation domain-containing protein [Candidatus Sumerlaeaceae bacterium]|nr:prepilin-type N-terminal cleavage/methylation domain-containing protein [Candidatus Sumerlaeaceae bacterium]